MKTSVRRRLIVFSIFIIGVWSFALMQNSTQTIESLFSGLALVAIVVTIYQQSEDFKHSLEEQKHSLEEQKAVNENMSKQLELLKSKELPIFEIVDSSRNGPKAFLKFINLGGHALSVSLRAHSHFKASFQGKYITVLQAEKNFVIEIDLDSQNTYKIDLQYNTVLNKKRIALIIYDKEKDTLHLEYINN